MTAGPAFAPPPFYVEEREVRMASDAQRATLERAGAGRGCTPLKLTRPSSTTGMVSIYERRAPKRRVATLDILGRRVRWNPGARAWELWPWRFDPDG